MKAISAVLLVASLCKSNGDDGYLPPYITPCDFETDFQTCVKEQIEQSLPVFTKGVPELGVPSLEPLNLDDIKIDQNGLKLVFKHSQLHGISNSKLSNFTVNIKDEAFSLSFVGTMNLTATYEVDGRILILPIQGQGDAIVDAEDILVEIRSKLTIVNDSKGEHLKLLQPNYNYNIGSTKFTFKNLFNGNKVLSEATHKFANENWQQIMDDIAPPVIKQIVRTGVRAINKFFSKVTIPQIIKNFSLSGH